MSITDLSMITPPTEDIQMACDPTKRYMDPGYYAAKLDTHQTLHTNLYSTSNIYQPICSNFSNQPRVIQWSPSKGSEGETLSIILEQPLTLTTRSTLPSIDNPPMKVVFGNVFLDTIQQHHIIPPADPRKDPTQMLWTTLIARVPSIPDTHNIEQKVPITICIFADEDLIRKRSVETTDEPKISSHKRYNSSNRDAINRSFDFNDLEIILLLAPAVLANDRPPERQPDQLESSLSDTTPFSQLSFKETNLTPSSQQSSTFSYSSSSSSSSTPSDPGKFMDQSPEHPSLSSEYASTVISNSFSTSPSKASSDSPFSINNCNYSTNFNLVHSGDIDSSDTKDMYTFSPSHLEHYTERFNDHESIYSHQMSADIFKQFKPLQTTQISNLFPSSVCVQSRKDQIPKPIAEHTDTNTNTDRSLHCSYPHMEQAASAAETHKLYSVLTKPLDPQKSNNLVNTASQTMMRSKRCKSKCISTKYMMYIIPYYSSRFHRTKAFLAKPLLLSKAKQINLPPSPNPNQSYLATVKIINIQNTLRAHQCNRTLIFMRTKPGAIITFPRVFGTISPVTNH
ncbi:hypothetical protein CLU79DRAFT_831391 [Phycomyces nitens]|nr:hypothetical protein CLU79DRAFT_831391 [Phycomyces nitens]